MYYFFFFLFFYEGGKPRRAARFGSVRRGEPLNRARNIDSQFGSEQKSGKSVSSLLQPPPDISPHPTHIRSPFVPSSLSIDLNVTQPWHGFTRLLAGRVFYIFLLRFSPSWCALPPPAIPRSLLLLCFSFCSLFFFLAQSLRHCICIWWNTRCKIFPSHRTYGNLVGRNGKRVESMRFCRNREIYFTIIRSSNNSRVKQSLDWVLCY